MRRIYGVPIGFIIISLICGCNIVPKSVQYQKEEERLIGSTDAINPLVEEVQVVLDGLGYDAGAKDGRMGQKTREAIKQFQESIGVKETGYINKLTFQQIEDIRRVDEERSLKHSYKIEVRSASSQDDTDMPTITITQIQTALKNAGFNPGAIDGKMGPRTKQAVKEFQRAKDLKVDGVVGPATWSGLRKYLK